MHILKGKVLITTYELNKKGLIISNRRRDMSGPQGSQVSALTVTQVSGNLIHRLPYLTGVAGGPHGLRRGRGMDRERRG